MASVAQTPKTLAQMQAERAARAVEQMASYSFRTVRIPVLNRETGATETHKAVYVTSPEGAVYTCSDLHRCSCGDFQKRGASSGVPCKHLFMAYAHLRAEKAHRAPDEQEQERRAAIRARIDVDFPDA